MKLAHKATKYLVTGASGSGKSTFARRLALNSFAQGRYGKLLVFDHDGEFSLRSGIESAFTVEELCDDFEKRNVAVFDPSHLYPGDNETAWDFFCEWCFLCGQHYEGSILFYCDEIQLFVGTDTLSSQFQKLVETGRRWGIDTLAITQQYNLVHNRLRNQITHLISFVQRDIRAIQALEERGFYDVDFQRLGQGEYVILTPDGIVTRNKIEFDGKSLDTSGNCAEAEPRNEGEPLEQQNQTEETNERQNDPGD